MAIPSQDYFADGITEDLTSDLSRIAGSFVISRNTAFTFKGKAVDARQIGRELGVRYVLEGGVRRMGGTVRVNAQLIDAGTGAHLWSEQMDVDQRTVASSPDSFGIANRLARMLSVELVNVEGRRAQRANPDAVDLTMRGWAVLNGGPTSKDDVQTIRRVVRGCSSHRSREQSGPSRARPGPHSHLPQPLGSRACPGARPGRRSSHAGHLHRAQLRPGPFREGRGSRVDQSVRCCACDVRSSHRPGSEPCGGLRWTGAELDRDRSRSRRRWRPSRRRYV